MNIDIMIPTKVENIMNHLNSKGFNAFVVGGCVRDMLMGDIPHDWDICSSALPHEVKEIFEHVIPTGEKHGTVTVMLDGDGFEVTTFRTDGIYSDGRHPDSVMFTRSLEDDLMRRDFTINAMAYNSQVGLVDLFDGQADIKHKRIKCVGNPNDRFAEDALRMMRAVRFSAQKEFFISQSTFTAIIDNAWRIKSVSFERIRDEIVKIITSNCPEKFSVFYYSGLLAHISPELNDMFGCKQNNPHHVFSVSGHSMVAMNRIKNELPFRLAMLFHDSGKPVTKSTDENGIDHFYGHEIKSFEITENVMTRLKFDTDTINKTSKMVLFHMANVVPTKMSIKRWMNRIGSVEEFIDLMTVKIADAKAQNTIDFIDTFSEISKCISLAVEIRDAGEVFNKSKLAINGYDLIEIGVPQSRRMSEIIDALVQIVIDVPEYNTKEKLISIVRKMEW
jgi:tRNA nucleotidyltransferase (CCA-adding enzyme)